MRKITRRWGEEVGSVDFMQLIIGLLIVGVACVGTFASLQWGNENLNAQMRYRKAMSIARSDVEYWQGRIHTDVPSAGEMEGNLNASPAALEKTLLDRMNPRDPNDDIYCYVKHGKIDYRTDPELGVDKQGQPLVAFWVLYSEVTWWEPDQVVNVDRPNKVSFQGSMVPAAL